ncbi:MAG: hypothetical protein HN919_14655 [Verrucomicrobia bacterium]|jgi:hypothetical protein|nr:hypothetical protein [Verrucomicrobiota bacterium]MBT7067539.1 hypothetical protein [Verrucomicrobiota bacterium]MBT7698696.1 hypothetical protein [Verrucomicrobiota bacterium]
MLRRDNRKGRRDGFTIVEAVIASVIFFVITGSFIAAYLSAMRTHMMATDLYRATCIARNRIQRARTLDYGSLSLLGEQDAAVDELGNVVQGGAFRRTTVVSATTPACTRIAVTVQFPIPNGRVTTNGVDVATMITEGM